MRNVLIYSTGIAICLAGFLWAIDASSEFAGILLLIGVPLLTIWFVCRLWWRLYLQLVTPYCPVATRLKAFGFLLLQSLLLILPLNFAYNLVLNRDSDRVLLQSLQPKEINYQSFDPYHFLVVQDRYRNLVVGSSPSYFIFIGREPEPGSYGYRLDYSFAGFDGELKSHLANSIVEWTREGVTFSEPSGQKVFIPKDHFIGGR